MKNIFSNTTKSTEISKAIESTRQQIEALTIEADHNQELVGKAISEGKSPDTALATMAGNGLKVDALSKTLARLEQEHAEAQAREDKELLTTKFNLWKKNSTDEAGKIDKLLQRALSIAKDLQEIEQEASKGVESIISTAQEIGLKISLPGIPGGPMKAIYSRDFNARELVRAAGDYMVNVIGRASIDE